MCVHHRQQYNLPDFNPNCTDNVGAFTCNVRDIIKVISKLKDSSSSSMPGPDGDSVYFLDDFCSHCKPIVVQRVIVRRHSA